MAEVMIWSPMDRILWGITLILLLIAALKYLFLAYKKENSEEKLISIGFSAIFFGFIIFIVFILIAESLIPGKFVNDTLYGNYDKALENPYYIIFWKMYHFFWFFGMILFYYAFERIIRHTKYLITISWSFGLILIIILPYELARFFIYNIFAIFQGIFYMGILFFYTRSSRRELKGISSFILLGSILNTYGTLLAAEIVKRLNVIPLIFAPILLSIGTLLCIIPTTINPESILKYLKIAYPSTIGMYCIFIIYALIYNFPLGLIIANMIGTFLVILIVYNVIKSPELSEDKDEVTDFFEAWAKPKKVTEEEVTISKEKKICLVCKGKTSRLTYICPECDAIYCVKCSNTMSDLENACWACETPFDESKPVKPYKKEEEKVEVEEKIQKTSNNK